MSNPFVVTVKDEPHLFHTKVEVTFDPTYPKDKPLFSMALADGVLAKIPVKVEAAHVAKHMAAAVAKAVEQSIYQALTGGPVTESLDKVVHEHKAEMLKKYYSAPLIQDTAFYKELFLGDTALKKDQFYIAPKKGQLSWDDPAVAVWDELKAYWQQKIGASEAAPGDHIHPSLAALEKAIPGFGEMEQPCPVDTCATWHASQYKSPETPLHKTIIHLNDSHKWTREEIADWLETLDHDLTFKAPEEVNNGNGN